MVYLIRRRTFSVLAIALTAGILTPTLTTTAAAKNMRLMMKEKRGKSDAAWAKSGVKKFIRGYAEGHKYKIISGSESNWKPYKGRDNIKITKVTYDINGHKRNVAYVWAYVDGKSFLGVVANASARQQALAADIRKAIKPML